MLFLNVSVQYDGHLHFLAYCLTCHGGMLLACTSCWLSQLMDNITDKISKLCLSLIKNSSSVSPHLPSPSNPLSHFSIFCPATESEIYYSAVPISNPTQIPYQPGFLKNVLLSSFLLSPTLLISLSSGNFLSTLKVSIVFSRNPPWTRTISLTTALSPISLSYLKLLNVLSSLS